jgi:nitrite reductase (cytochrome c-552)
MKRRFWWIAAGVVVILVLAGSLYYTVATREVPAAKAVATGLDPKTIDPAAFKNLFPAEYESYLKNQENNPPALKYNSSEVKKSKLDQYPYMRTLWAGYAFSKEYNEARGHAYVLSDTIGETKTARIGAASNLTCMYCKSAQVPGLIEKMGNAFYNTKLLEGNNKDQFHLGISCSDCHDPATMALRVTRPAFIEAMQRRGTPVDKFTNEQMRSAVCGQCHVEYFFNPKDNLKVYFPWDKGFEWKDIYAYYQEQGFSDWTHPQTSQGMVKAQHPEYEMFQGSVHQNAGLACADCHMPYMKQGDTKISSHWWTSPFRTYEQSCSQCHKESEEVMQKNVLNIQDRVKSALDRAGEANKAAILAIEKTSKIQGFDATKLNDAKQLQRQAQFYWDLISAENSMGFHNPPKAMQGLTDSIDLARQAEVKATEAAQGAAK